MPRTLMLFTISGLLSLLSGFAIGKALGLVFETGDPQGAIVWACAAMPVLATGAWCFFMGNQQTGERHVR